MAYAAVASLLQTLDQIIDSHRPMIFYDMGQIEKLHAHFSSLLEFLENSTNRGGSEEFEAFAAKFRDKAYEAEDLIESLVYTYHSFYAPALKPCSNLLSVVSVPGLFGFGMWFKCKFWWRYRPLDGVVKQIDSIVDEVEGFNQRFRAQNPNIVNSCSDDSSMYTRASVGNKVMVGSSSMKLMVGHEYQLLRIKDQLTGSSSNLQVIPISGMGGIGKTTMAEKIYNDRGIKSQFDVLAWVTITQEYNVRDVLLELLDSLGKVNDKTLRQSTDGLAEQLHKTLMARRYLIVMDDVWDIGSWDQFRRFFPDNRDYSRVILTTRLENVAVYAAGAPSPLYQVPLLNADECWELLYAKVFGEERCPIELERIGKKIARRCKGLPLAVVVIAGLLSIGNKTPDEWENVAENLHSAAADDGYGILRLSYNHLPEHLKACFLYMGLFPENYRIPVSKLIKLWIAEGFLRRVDGKSLEESAEEYLLDLIERSLILICHKRVNGRVKTIHIHDLLRDLCIEEARKEKFLQVMNRSDDRIQEGTNSSRRVSLDPNISVDDSIFKCLAHQYKFSLASYLHLASNPLSLNPFQDAISASLIRSLLYTGGQPIPSIRFSRFLLLRSLDISRALLFEFPMEILKLVNLRYLAFPYHGEVPEAISQLYNLETIIFSPLFKRFAPSPQPLPLAIWSLPRLRHLKFHVWYLSKFPCVLPGWRTHAFLANLQSLSEVNASFCTMEILQEVPNLKKLGIWMETWDAAPFYINNLFRLEQLEVLKCCVRSFPTYDAFPLPNYDSSLKLAFPAGLKELTLTGCRIPWEGMTIVGSLPNLEKLKLRDYAFVGPEWAPIEGEFVRLSFLLLDGSDLVHWDADDTHFPCLKHLILRNCWKLENIPDDIAAINTLEIIEIDNSSPSALYSAEQIAMEQFNSGNDGLRVSITGA